MEILKEKLTFEEKMLIKNANQKTDWWDELSQAQKEDIQLGIAQADAGEVVSYESMLERYGVLKKC